MKLINRNIALAAALLATAGANADLVKVPATPVDLVAEKARHQTETAAPKADVPTSWSYPIDYSDNWVSVGEADYTDDVMTTFFNVENLTWKVEVEENADLKGVYRLVNPYSCANCPFAKLVKDFQTTGDDYILINAHDPEGVFIEFSDLHLDFGYGNVTVGCWAAYYFNKEDNTDTLEDMKASGRCGRLVDGNIFFEKKDLTVQTTIYYENNIMYANFNRGFRVVLPGGKDHTLKLNYKYCTDDPTNHSVEVTLGEGLSNVKYAFKKAFDGTNLYGDNQKTYDDVLINGFEALDGSFVAEYNLIDEGGEGKYLFNVIGLGSDGSIVAKRCAELYYIPDEEDDWVSHGYTSYRDDYFGSIINGVGQQAYKVEIQTNPKRPGVYRLVNPYSEDNYDFIDDLSYETSHNHYMIIHAEKPDACWVEETPIGVSYFGDVRVSSRVALWYSWGNSLESIMRFNEYVNLFGTFNSKTNTITFKEGCLAYSDRRLQGGEWIDVNNYSGFKLVIPESALNASVEGIEIDKDAIGHARIYNLQGVEVNEDTMAPGMYIRVNGDGSAEKFYTK